jgi:subtilisin family serine protease
MHVSIARTLRDIVAPTMRRTVLAALACLLATAHASSVTVDTVIVRLRDDAVVTAPLVFPTGHRLVVSAALGTGVTQIGRIGDGAFRLALESPLPISDAELAINRVRALPQVLYAQLAARIEPPRVHPKAGTPDDSPLDRIIVKYRDAVEHPSVGREAPLSQTRVDRIANLAGVMVVHERVMFNGANVVALFRPLPRVQVELIAQALMLDADVEYAHPDYRKFPGRAPNDPNYSSQWHYLQSAGGINLPAAWNRTVGSPAIRIAVLDTGVLPRHPDLERRLIGGYDFISHYITANDGSTPVPIGCTPGMEQTQLPCIRNRDPDPSDPGNWVSAADVATGFFPPNCVTSSTWHGTHVAGTIGADTDNGIGVAGVNWVSPIVPVRVLGKCGGYDSDIADAIAWAAGELVPGVPANPNPARVINLSLYGPDPCTQIYVDAFLRAANRMATVVTIAGNENDDARNYSPGNCGRSINVSAIGAQGQRASYSNYNTAFGPISIAAPGGSDGNDVLSTMNTGATVPMVHNYGVMHGTSMAAPHVAGVVSLVLSLNSDLTPGAVQQLLEETARPFPQGTNRDCATLTGAPIPPGTTNCGWGIVDPAAAMAKVSSIPWTATIDVTPNPATFGQEVIITAKFTNNFIDYPWSIGAGFVIDERIAASFTCPGNDGNTEIGPPHYSLTAVCHTLDFHPHIRERGIHTVRAIINGRYNDQTIFAASTPTVSWVVNPQPPPPPLRPIKQRDFNNDGRGDILWRSSLGRGHAIWLMNGASATTSANIGLPADWLVTHTADFNNDGRHDLVVRHPPSGQTGVWLMLGASYYATASLLTDPNWAVTHTGDFNGDGRADLIWYNASTGTTSMWLMNGTAFSSGATLMSRPEWTITHVADFNGDSKDDLVWRNSVTGETAIWLMNGTNFAGGAIILALPQWSVIQIGDFNADRRADLVWRNAATGDVNIWLMTGYTMSSGARVLSDRDWIPTHVVDLDGDASTDIVWRNSVNGSTSVWLMNGLSVAGGNSITVVGSSIVATGDYNGDGRADLIWYNPTSGLTQMHLMTTLGREDPWHEITVAPSLVMPLITTTDWQVRP